MKHLVPVTIIGFLAIILGYFLLYLFPFNDFHKHPQPSKSTPIIFSTRIFASKVEWFSEYELLITSLDSVAIYNVTDRTSKTVFDVKIGEIIDTAITHNSINILIKSKDDTYFQVIDRKGTAIEPIPILKADHFLIGSEKICLTTTKTIYDPKETATEIRIISTEENPRDIGKLSTHLTLIPLNCDNFLYLQPPYPILQDKVYYWDTRDSNTDILLLHKFSEKDPVEKVNIQNGHIGIQSKNSVLITKLKAEIHKDSQKLYDINSDTIDGWGISDFGHLVTIEEDTIVIYEEEKKKDSIKLNMPYESFTEIIPSPGQTSFALISSSGELWILQR